MSEEKKAARKGEERGREQFDPTKVYGTLPARLLKKGDRVKNEKLYPATVWEVSEVNTAEGLIAVSCDKGQGVFSAPYKWTHEDGTAIRLTLPTLEETENAPGVKCPVVGIMVNPRCTFTVDCPVHGASPSNSGI